MVDVVYWMMSDTETQQQVQKTPLKLRYDLACVLSVITFLYSPSGAGAVDGQAASQVITPGRWQSPMSACPRKPLRWAVKQQETSKYSVVRGGEKQDRQRKVSRMGDGTARAPCQPQKMVADLA